MAANGINVLSLRKIKKLEFEDVFVLGEANREIPVKIEFRDLISNIANFIQGIDLATVQEVNAGINNTKFVTPKGFQESDIAVRFVWTLDLIDLQNLTLYAPRDIIIEAVEEVVNTVITTIVVNGNPYNLNNLILKGSQININVDAPGVINLKIKKE